MQAKGLIQFFVIAFIVVCIFQLSFTFVARKWENKATEYANSIVNVEDTNLDQLSFEERNAELRKNRIEKRRFLDSMSSETVMDLGVFSYDYKSVKDKQINLGLDLKGGISMVLEVSVENVIKGLSNNSQDPIFKAAIEDAKKRQLTASQPYLVLFQRAFEDADPNAKLANIFAPLQEFQGKVGFDDTNDEVIAVLKKEVDAAVENTYNVIRARIDQFGVAQPNINFQKNTGRIFVELPGADDPSRIKSLIEKTAELEFWHTYENEEVLEYFVEANDRLREILELTDTAEADDASEDILSGELDPLANDKDLDNTIDALEETAEAIETAADPLLNAGNDTGTNLAEDSGLLNASADEQGLGQDQRQPLFEVLQINIDQDQQNVLPGPMIGYCYGRDTGKVNDYLKMEQIKSIFPRELKLLWSAKPVFEENNIYGLYSIQVKDPNGNPPLNGDVVTTARQDFDQFGNPSISLSMNSTGANKWAKITKDAINDPLRNRSIAIVLDNRVYSAPTVQSEIKGGQSQITGAFDLLEAIDLANILKAGKLEAPAKIIQEDIVGPTLGQESVNAGLMSLLIGLGIVLVFMVFYYGSSGWISNLALILNLFFIIGTLSSLGAALTLPGMAGIVLTIGMAVDANVIIFERIREELERGKGPRLALTDGFKNSYSAIIDANVTTLITAIILLYFGLGPVKGFATVLVIGIVSSLFTAVVFSRLIFDYLMSKDKKVSFYTGLTRGAFKNISTDFLGRSKITYIISLVIILVGIGSFLTRGFEYGVDFKGGRKYVVDFGQNINRVDVANALKGPLEGTPQVTTYGVGGSQLQITTDFLVNESGPEIDSIVQTNLFSGLSGFFSPPISEVGVFVKENIKTSAKVESSIADDIRKSAVWVTIFGSLAIFLYILIRFRKWQFGIGALAAILHDVLIILGVFTIFKNFLPFNLEVDQAFIAALLTVIGYSINDTVVVFDRIREYLNLHPTTDLTTNVNNAIKSTISRTLITSLTTLFVVLVLFVLGGEAIRGFSFALMIGILVGTYSSIFIASPVTVDLLKRSGVK